MGDSLGWSRWKGRSGIIAAEAVEGYRCRAFVYSSVADANKKTGIPHFDSKYLVEKLMPVSAFPTPSARRRLFMETSLRRVDRSAAPGNVRLPDASKRVIQLVAVADIGAFVCGFDRRRDPFFGKRFDLAGDELSGREQAKILRTPSAHNHFRRPASPRRASKAGCGDLFDGSTALAPTPISPHCVGIFGGPLAQFADWAREFDWSVLEWTSSCRLRSRRALPSRICRLSSQRWMRSWRSCATGRPPHHTTISREFDEAGVKRDRRWLELREREHVRNRPTRLLRPIRLRRIVST